MPRGQTAPGARQGSHFRRASSENFAVVPTVPMLPMFPMFPMLPMLLMHGSIGNIGNIGTKERTRGRNLFPMVFPMFSPMFSPMFVSKHLKNPRVY